MRRELTLLGQITAAVGLILAAPSLPERPGRAPETLLTSFGFPSRERVMPGFGRSEILSPSQIEDLTDYVVALSGREAELRAIERAVPLYEQHCQACHGIAGEGDPGAGVPDLRDEVWRLGGTRAAIRQQIWRGDDGRGPLRSASAGRRPDPWPTAR